jgi:hypothetical protein
MVQKTLLATVLTVAAAPGTMLGRNALIKRSMVLALALLASGCGGQQQAGYQAQYQNQAQMSTNGQRQMAMIKGTMATVSSSLKTCYEEVHSHPDLVAVNELLPLADPSQASISQLASTARPTHNQITKIVALKQSIDKCDEQTATKLRDVDTAFYDIVHRYDQNLDGIIVELMHGKLKLGEATHAAQMENQRFQGEAKALAQKIEANLLQQHNMEIAQRQAIQAQQQAAQAQAQAQGEADLAAFGNSMAAASAQFNQSAQQRLQAATSFQPTPVMPITPPGGNQIRCINTGIYTNCRY